MEKRGGGVDQERVAGGRQAHGPVGGLKEEEAGDDERELGPPVDAHFDGYPQAPYRQRRREEHRCLAAGSHPRRRHFILSRFFFIRFSVFIPFESRLFFHCYAFINWKRIIRSTS